MRRKFLAKWCLSDVSAWKSAFPGDVRTGKFTTISLFAAYKNQCGLPAFILDHQTQLGSYFRDVASSTMSPSAKNKLIRLLIVKDSLEDYESILEALQKLALPTEQTLVSEEKEFRKALTAQRWDVVVLDLGLGSFSALDALRMSRDLNIGDLPVIVLATTLAQITELAAQQAKAQAYLLKDNVALLAPTIKRELEIRSERARSMRELHESEAKFAGFIAQAMDAIISINEKQEIILFNAAAEAMFGYSADQIIGRSLNAIIPPEFHARHQGHVAHFSRGLPIKRTMNRLGELRGLRSDNSQFPIEASISLQNLHGEKIMTAIVRDITERKRLEEQLYQSQKFEVLGEIAGGVAHDFNNILGIILGFAELTKSELASNKKLSSNLDSIISAARRGKDIVSEILTFGSGHGKFSEPLSVSELCAEIVTFFSATRPGGPRFTVQNNCVNHDVVEMQKVHLQQLLMNLCTNAVHALRNVGDPQLAIVLERVDLHGGQDFRSALDDRHLSPGRYVRITVRDNGRGIPEEVQKDIFTPFFTTKPRGTGSGLGLAVVSRIVLGYHGGIAVQSALGVGTTFDILLPYSEKRPESKTEIAPDPSENSDRGHILLVDDEEVLCSLLKQMLELLGYTVDSFMRPRAALDAFLKSPHSYDAVLTDHSMPEMEGTKLIREVRKCRKDIPCLLSSGYGEAAELSGLTKGKLPVRLIAKPYTIDELSRMLRSTLREARE